MQKLSDEQLKKLIDLVQAKPELYDKRHDESKNVSLKEKIWSDIASEVCARDRDVRKAWKSVRDQFHRSLLYMTKAKEGVLTKPIQKYKHFNRLLFLVESPELRKSLSNTPLLIPMKTTKDPLKVKSSKRRASVDFEETTFEFSGIEEFLTMNKQPTSDYIKEEEPTCSSNFDISAESASSTAFGVEDVEEHPLQIYVKDSHTGFLDMVAEQLNKLPKVTQEETKMKILTLLHNEVKQVIRTKQKRRRSK